MDQSTSSSDVCMACACPCEMHKEHNHPVEAAVPAAEVCTACGHEHKKPAASESGFTSNQNV